MPTQSTGGKRRYQSVRLGGGVEGRVHDIYRVSGTKPHLKVEHLAVKRFRRGAKLLRPFFGPTFANPVLQKKMARALLQEVSQKKWPVNLPETIELERKRGEYRLATEYLPVIPYSRLSPYEKRAFTLDWQRQQSFLLKHGWHVDRSAFVAVRIKQHEPVAMIKDFGSVYPTNMRTRAGQKMDQARRWLDRKWNGR